MAAKWLTMAEYARRNGISREAVRQAVKAERIEHNGKTGRECRVRGELMESTRIAVPAVKPSDQSADLPAASLAEVKLEKLRADIELQRQRINENRDAMRREFAEAVIEEYLRAFAPLKTQLTEMRLDAVKLAVLRKLIDSCTASFETALRKRMVSDE